MSAARDRILDARYSAQPPSPAEPRRWICRFSDGRLRRVIATGHRRRSACIFRKHLRVRRHLALAALVRA